MLGSNVAQGGAALAVSVKSKRAEIKQLASSAGITAVCGITEPALYGVNMKYKTPLYAAMAGGGIGGLFMGITKVRNYSGGSPGLLTLPSYIGGDSMNGFYFACIGAVISLVTAFIITMVIYKDPEDEQSTETVETVFETSSHGPQDILAPITGKAVALTEVNDSTFSEGIVGKGAAIIPTVGKVLAPVDGKIVTIFNTKHAIAVQADTGAEILIHIGIDTVKLEGKYFEVFKKNGDAVKKGDLIATFDIEGIKKEGYDVITPVVITNHDDYNEIRTKSKNVNALDAFIQII